MGLEPVQGAPALPVPAAVWVKSGAATRQTANGLMTIRQRSQNATLKWDSFNIGAGNTVRFQQPKASSVALNLIGQADPVRIFGTLNANGQVYLINRNGIVFGRSAKVDVAGLIASTLRISEEAAAGGILRAAADGKPAFSAFTDGSGKPTSGVVSLENGASVRAAKGGSVLIFAPVVRNDGAITTPDGQTILAAGEKIYLMASNDTNLRGLLVEVDVSSVADADLDAFMQSREGKLPAGIVSNGGEISTARGNTTLAGLVVNQQGRISATTAVNANGTIRLQARDRVTFVNQASTVDGTAVSVNPAVPARGGRVSFAPGSTSAVTSETDDPATQLAVNAQNPSRLNVTGRQIEVQAKSTLQAQGGVIELRARTDLQANRKDDSRIHVASGATLDVSGTSATLPASAHVLSVRLTATQLADSPVLRDGALRGQSVTVDTFRTGTREDGTHWVGTPIGDISSVTQTVAAPVGVRTSAGGTVSLSANGAAFVAPGALFNLRGGLLHYAAGVVPTSLLITAYGQVVDIAEADPATPYVGVFGRYERLDKKWGVARSWQVGIVGLSPEYHLTQANGSLKLVAPRLYFAGDVQTESARGDTQRGIPDGGRSERLPAGGTLVVGDPTGGVADANAIPDYVTDDVLLAVTPSTLSSLRNAQGERFDPLTDTVPEALSTSQLSANLFGRGRLQQLAVYSNGSITLPAGAQLELPEAGSLTLAASHIAIAGSVRAPGGIFSASVQPTQPTTLADVGFELQARARIDLSGQWVNDHTALANATLPAATLIKGGSVTIEAKGGPLRLARGSEINVDGGAWLSATELHAGSGGDITLATHPLPDITTAIPVEMKATLSAYALKSSGTLTLALPALRLAEDGRSGEADASGTVSLSPTLLQSGFADYTLRANFGSLEVAAGAVVKPQVLSRILAADFGRIADADSLAGLSRIALLPDAARPAANLSLEQRAAPLSAGYDTAHFASAGTLEVGRGAKITLDPGGHLALFSDTAMAVDGTLVSPGGQLDLTLDNSLALSTGVSTRALLNRQSVWLGPHSRLLAPGFVKSEPTSTGVPLQTINAGGSINVLAKRGYVLQQAGSLLDASGAAAPLALTPGASGTLGIALDSAGGSIGLEAGEGMILDGTLRAAGGGPHALGGSLSVELDPTGRNEPPDSLPESFTRLPATVALSDSPDAVTRLSAFAAAPARALGRAVVPVSLVAEGGFASLTLSSHNQLARNANGELIAGGIALLGNPDLTLTRNLTLNAASLLSSGGQAHLAAPYVALGNSAGTTSLAQAVPDAVPGEGSLTVDAALIDLVGNSRAQGFADLDFRSRGDVRFIGVQDQSSPVLAVRRALKGAFLASGNLQFTASQLYPTTLSDFRVAIDGAPDGRITLAGRGAPPPTPLSALGSLSLEAPALLQSGVLRAPFGALSLKATRDLVLTPGSLTSTSANGALIPFGLTQGGFDWAYPLAGGETLVYDGKLNTLATPGVTLDGGRAVRLQKGAVVDISAGGDLLAYEFAPGPNGTRDVLSPAVSPDSYALLPSARTYAPYDPLFQTDSLLEPGDSLHLEATPLLAAGTYTLLPARYALLPGAVLVTRVETITTPDRFAPARLSDGSQLATGYRTVTDTGLTTGVVERYALLPGTAVQRFAQYTLSRATAFFSAQSSARNTARQVTPADAGRLQVLARGTTLELAASLRAASSAGGRAAEVDVASERAMEIVSGKAAGGDNLQIAAGELNQLAAPSLLLGGLRHRAGASTQLETLTSRLTLDSGAVLRGSELLLAASDTLRISASAGVRVEGMPLTAALPLTTNGDGTLLQMSSGPRVSVVRRGESAEPTRGTFELEAGATLATSGALLIDASKDTDLAGSLEMAGGALSLGAARISLGEVGDLTSGLRLDNTQLAGLDVDELVLSSRRGVDLYGDISRRFGQLVIEGPGLAGYADTGQQAVLTTDTLSLRNPGGFSYQAPQGRTVGNGRLSLRSGTLDFGTGAAPFTFTGFSRIDASASQYASASGTGSVQVLGDLNLQTPLITARSDADLGLVVSGVLSLRSAADVPAEPALTGLGARLDFSAKRIIDSARISLPAGDLALRTTGTAADDDLLIEEGALMSVAGRELDFNGVRSALRGGSITLESRAGDVQLAPGSMLDLSAPAPAAAGHLVLRAPAGRAMLAGNLRANPTAAAALSGDAGIEVNTLDNLTALDAALDGGGFHARRSFHARNGNVLVGAGETISAAEIELQADRGDLTVAGTLEASGEQAGSLRLMAGGRVSLEATGRITASATGKGEAGGQLFVSSAAQLDGSTAVGGVRTATGSIIALEGGAGGAGGEAVFRLPRASALSANAAQVANRLLVLEGEIEGSASTVIEGFRAYTLTTVANAQVAASVDNPLFAQAQTFADAALDLKTALGRADDASFHVRPGVEVRSTRDLTVSAAWNLNEWRFNDEPGVLTLRAPGNLKINANLSDGFTSALTNTSLNLQASGESWSYRLAAGADLQAADPLAVQQLNQLAVGTGSFTLGGGTVATGQALPALRVIRTGTGDIDIAAGRDLVLTNAASVIYTAGHAAADGVPLGASGQLGNRPYPVNGGDLRLHAGGDMLGAPSDQLITAWLFRSGRPLDANGPDSAVGWTVAFERFQQGVGALAGGTVALEAGGNLSNFSAVVPTIGRQTAGISLEASEVEISGGGALSVTAGGDIQSGVYYLGRGLGTLTAGGSLTSGRSVSLGDPTPLYTTLALGDGHLTVEAADDLTLEAVINPTLVTQSAAQRGAGLPKLSYFSTYAPGSALTLISVAGNVSLNQDASALATATSSVPITTAGDLRSLAIAPPLLKARAFGGSIAIQRGFTLAPSAQGSLSLLARDHIDFASGADVVVADTDPALMGTPEAPVSRFFNPTGGHAQEALHLAGLAGTNEVLTAFGDITMERDARLVTPSATRVAAGRDLNSPNLVLQHVLVSDLSEVSAGRDLSYPLARDQSGNILQIPAGIALAGPGRLRVEANEDVDLGTSRGIETIGNQINPALPSLGASLDLSAGLSGQQPDYARFVARYLGEKSPVNARLVAFVNALAGRLFASTTEAFAYFRDTLSPRDQAAFANDVLFAELSKAGRAAAAAQDSARYQPGFAAAEGLFPQRAVQGGLSLFFSKIYTLAGGDINLLVPGGTINAGLATVGAGFGVNKLASDLGIVAQSTGNVRAFARDDILVNQSRIFAADGGSLLLWSSRGDIDAGRGAKTAISAPPPTITTDANGNVVVRFPPALTGSGIQNFVTTPGRTPGDVELYAPSGFVNASDAGVGSAGKVFTSLNVVNSTNIAAAGGVVGVPAVDAGALSGALAGAVGSASAAAQAANTLAGGGAGRDEAAGLDRESINLSLISVEFLGFGE